MKNFWHIYFTHGKWKFHIFFFRAFSLWLTFPRTFQIRPNYEKKMKLWKRNSVVTLLKKMKLQWKMIWYSCLERQYSQWTAKTWPSLNFSWVIYGFQFACVVFQNWINAFYEAGNWINFRQAILPNIYW